MPLISLAIPEIGAAARRLLRTFGPIARMAARTAVHREPRRLRGSFAAPAEDDVSLERFGVLSRGQLRGVHGAALRDVITPCLQALALA